ncbi:MAG: hypothetical protein ACTSYG_05565 [Candidatus Heimdallarchaeota archaeon]
MLIELYEITEDGEDIQIDPNDVKVTHDSLLIVVSFDSRRIYLFKGSNVSIVQKFASARKASALRLQKGGYPIIHIEEAEGIDEEFKPILEYLGGIVDEEEKEKSIEQPRNPPPAQIEKPKPPPSKTVTTKTTTTTTTKKKTTKTTTSKKTTPTKTKQPAKRKGLKPPEDMPPKLAKVYTAMTALESPAKSSCDYVLIGNKLYLVIGENKSDLSQGKFSFEEVTTLPEGVFPVENYYPRILVSRKKILGVELWARR